MTHTPSGLFPSAPPRPAYREELPVRSGAIGVGVGAGVLWMLLFGLLGRDARGYCWWTITAALGAWAAAAILAWRGDRGIAAGVSIAGGVGLAIAMSVAMARWIGGDWPLW